MSSCGLGHKGHMPQFRDNKHKQLFAISHFYAILSISINFITSNQSIITKDSKQFKFIIKRDSILEEH